jgi:hypothetical protein
MAVPEAGFDVGGVRRRVAILALEVADSRLE